MLGFSSPDANHATQRRTSTLDFSVSGRCLHQCRHDSEHAGACSARRLGRVSDGPSLPRRALGFPGPFQSCPVEEPPCSLGMIDLRAR